MCKMVYLFIHNIIEKKEKLRKLNVNIIITLI